VSRELISNVTEVVVDEIKAWQSRPLDEGQFLAIVANPGRMGLRCLATRRTRCLPVSSANTSN
jgi:transposase-like protein